MYNQQGDRNLGFAVILNVLLTIAQVIGGLLSGSLSLLADALHNLSDAGAIVVALVARKISRKSADSHMSYGYKRAEIVGVLINSTSLILIGLYLINEAAHNYFNPIEIDGWIVIYLAGLALIIDLATAYLTYHAGASTSMNIKATFIHNLSDAFASLMVVIAGTLILLYQWYIVDVLATILISLYVIYHGVVLLKKSILIMMQAVPENIDLETVVNRLELLESVDKVYHIHVWQLDDQKLFFEGKVIVAGEDQEVTKEEVRKILLSDFSINHSTIETKLYGHVEQKEEHNH